MRAMRSLLLPSILVAVACGGSKPPATTTTTTPTDTAGARERGEVPKKPREMGSPYDAQTWIAKLDDPREIERAVTELEQIGDPRAIQPLGEAWLRENKPVRILQVMISLARPLTADEAKAMYVVDYEKTGRKASWDLVSPYLLRAVDEIDEANPRSVDCATKAADALGEAKLGLDELAELALKPVTKKMIVAQVAAIRAFGKFAGDVKAAKILAKLITREPPAHPRTAIDKANGRELEEKFGLHLAVTGASINAIAELRTDAAIEPLVLALYRTPELFTQVRRALVASGPKAKSELRRVLAGKHPEVNALFKAKKLGEYCGDRGDKPCQPVSIMPFYAAITLGDFHDPTDVPDLLAVLKTNPLPPYYVDDEPAPNSQHNAAFDALARIGAPDAAAPLLKLWKNGKTELQTRILAIAAFAMVSRDTAGVDDLGKIAADNAADDQIRTEAATAMARLSTSMNDVALFGSLAKKYFDAADKKAKEATVEKDAKLKKQIERAARAYVGYAHMFLTHIARIDTARACKSDLDCYARTLKKTPDEVAASVKKYIPDLASWTDDEKRGLLAAAIDRAMLEIGKQGLKATQHTDALLAAAVSEDREIRMAVLRAIPKIATLPCANCVTGLEAAMKAGEGKTTLGDLNIETAVLRNYFTWAGH